MPDIAASGHTAVFLIIGSNLDTIEDTLGSRNLIRAHNHEHILGCENTVLCQHIQNRMPRKERPREIDQIGDNGIIGISPIGREFKAVGGLFLFRFGGIGVLDSIETGAVGNNTSYSCRC